MRSDELEKVLGRRVRNAPSSQRLTQAEVAERANVSLGALKHLESGSGVWVCTLVKELRALGQEEWLDARAPDSERLNPLTSWPPVRPSKGHDRVRPAPPAGGPAVSYEPTDVIEVRPGARGSEPWPSTRRPAGTPSPTAPNRSRRHRVGPAAHGSAHRAQRIPPAPPRDVLRAATPFGRLAARQVRERGRRPLDGRAGGASRRHHPARPPGLRGADRALGALSSGRRRGRRGERSAERGVAGRPGAGCSSHGAGRVRQRRNGPRRSAAG